MNYEDLYQSIQPDQKSVKDRSHTLHLFAVKIKILILHIQPYTIRKHFINRELPSHIYGKNCGVACYCSG